MSIFLNMSTVLDYIAWRGDLSLDVVPFNEIDALIFCEFAYLKLKGIVPEEVGTDGVTLKEAAALFFGSEDAEERSDMGILFGKNVVNLFKIMAASDRYKNLELCGFVERLDTVYEKQFAAITVLLGDGSSFIVFRGTDDSLVGWKEDFNMCFMTPVPCQEEALNYLIHAASRLPGKLRVGGHSKGGNVSIYSSTFCGKKIQKRLIDVYNFDGPGFELDIAQAPEYQGIAHCVQTFVPDQSIVGLLMEYNGDYVVVKSLESGLMQHNLLSWQLEGPHFAEVERVSGGSVIIDRSVKSWLKELSSDQREQFVDSFYKLLTSSEASTLSELAEHWKKNPTKAVSAFLSVEPEARKTVMNAVQQFFKAAHQEIKMDVKAWFQEKLQESNAHNSLIKK